MEITTELVKSLRDKTGVSVMQCKKALEEAGGDMDKALAILQAKGAEIASKKSDRTLGAGAVATYLHSTGTIGAMVLLSSETDFVSKNEEFRKLAYELAMQVAATNPESAEKLLEEQYIKDSSKTVGQLIEGAVQKFGERIVISNFVRYSL